MNIAVAQSGGPTAAINSSLCGVFDEAEKYNEIDRIYGSLNGIEGILNDNLIDLKEVLITENDKQLLKRTPSTVLGSCRFKLKNSSDDDSDYKRITQNFAKHNGFFLYRRQRFDGYSNEAGRLFQRKPH